MFAAFIVLAGAASFADSTSEIQKCLTTYFEATRAHDAKTLDGLFAPSYVEVSPTGEVDSRERTLSFYTVPPSERGPVPSSMALKDLSVQSIARDIALAIFVEEVTIARGDKTMTMRFRVSSVLNRKKGRWQFVSNHFSPLRPQG